MKMVQILNLVFAFKRFVLLMFLNIRVSHPRASVRKAIFEVESLMREVLAFICNQES